MAAGEYRSVMMPWVRLLIVRTLPGQVYNPSFDVTPAELISCVVTEKGVAANEEGRDAIDLSLVL
jgi:methylthioribose-1-phosphate isomerase